MTQLPIQHDRTEVIPNPKAIQLGERVYNYLITWLPSHHVRQLFLRLLGVSIGRRSSIMMGTTILGARFLTIGDAVSIGGRCLLDARGGITIDDDVVIASDVQIITGKHLVNSPDFDIRLGPVRIKHHAWVASRSMVLQELTIGVGGVVAACSMVTQDVADMQIVGGAPAKPIGTRESTLDYHPVFRPILT